MRPKNTYQASMRSESFTTIISPATAGDASASAHICVYVQNMAGAVHAIDRLASDATVAELKHRLHAIDADCVVSRSRLMLMTEPSSDGDAAHTVLADGARTLASYGIVDATTLHSFVEPRTPGEHVRTIGSGKAGKEVGEFDSPIGVCMSRDGELVYVVEQSNHRVQELRFVDGAHVRTFEADLSNPRSLCLSPDGVFLFVSDTGHNCIKVLRIADGKLERTIGSKESLNAPYGVRITPNGAVLWACSNSGSCVQVFSVASGDVLHTIDGVDKPIEVCFSRAGDVAYVSDLKNDCVRVFRTADCVHLLEIGKPGSGAADLKSPWGVCLSADDSLLYVGDCGNHRVQVFSTTDGAHVHTIGAGVAVSGSSTKLAPNGRLHHPMGVCIAPDCETLLAVSYSGMRVEVFHS